MDRRTIINAASRRGAACTLGSGWERTFAAPAETKGGRFSNEVTVTL